MVSIKCVACNKSHNTIVEVKSCHKQHNAFIDAEPMMVNAKTIINKNETKVSVQKLDPLFKTFTIKQEAEDFIKKNPNSRFVGAVKVKQVNTWNKDTQSYQIVTTKTYTVKVN